ncbi:MAG: transglycosylase domain-containing protein [Nanoarchaeota archaeon]
MGLFRKKSTLDRVFSNYKTKKKSKLYKSCILGLSSILASIGITAGGYFLNQFPEKNKYLVEKKLVLPILKTSSNLFFKKEITDINAIELNNFESSIIYKCFNEETNKNDLVFYKRGDNKHINLNSLDEKIINGILSVEDPYFYSNENMSFFDNLRVHRGVDWISTTRAFYETVIKKNKVQGGSTITQQVLKKILENDKVKMRSSRFDLKLEEIVLAGKFEEKFGKDKILETHLNSFYIANNISGISAAMDNYFDLDNLNDASYKQILSIAAAISNPNNIFSKNIGVLYKISNGTKLEDLTDRETSFLNTWVAKYNVGVDNLFNTFNLINENEYNDLIIKKENLKDFILNLQLRQFDTIQKKKEALNLDLLINRHILENDFLVNDKKVSGSYLLNEFSGIVEVTTAIDLKKNEMLKEELLSHLNSDVFKNVLVPVNTDKKTLLKNINPSGAIINSKGHIIAYYGSRDELNYNFLSDTKSNKSIINTGSTFKPIIMYFVHALENKDIDEKFLLNVSQYKDKPSNWDNNNDPDLLFSIRETLERSINRPTAWAWMEYPRVRQAISNMFTDYGLEIFKRQEIDKYSISLGIDIEYPLFIPALYGALLTDGNIKYPRLVVDIKANGKNIEYANEQMKNLHKVKNYFPNSNSRKAILDSILNNSQVPLTPLKTGTYQDLQGNLTVGVSYLNQKEHNSYDGVNQYFVTFQKLKNLNGSKIGYSTHGSKIALENVVLKSNLIELERLKKNAVNDWKLESKYSNNSLFESKLISLYNDIINNKYGNFKRIYELDGALKQTNMNFNLLFDENVNLNVNNLKSMLKQYEKNLPKDYFILDKSKESHFDEQK